MPEWSVAGTVALTGIILVFSVLGLLNVAVLLTGKAFDAGARARNKSAGTQKQA